MNIFDLNIITQVALVVNDIEKTKNRLAELFGVEAPPTIESGEYSVTKTKVRGKPAPEANCKMAFFQVGDNVQLELIEPNKASSVWRDFLDEKGEGIHHIAFAVKDTDGVIRRCEEFGMTLLQRGNYGDGSGCYSYLDGGEGLPFIIETLESYS